jgi:hypothetical protein
MKQTSLNFQTCFFYNLPVYKINIINAYIIYYVKSRNISKNIHLTQTTIKNILCSDSNYNTDLCFYQLEISVSYYITKTHILQ